MTRPADASDLLYSLLPPFFRENDSTGQLRAFMRVLQIPYDSVGRRIDTVYANWFVETCAVEVLPELGALTAVSGLKPGWPEQRGLVADTLALRRRKGVPYALQRLATALTGWPAAVTTDAALDALAEGPPAPTSDLTMGPAQAITLTVWTKPLVEDAIAAVAVTPAQGWLPALRYAFQPLGLPVAARVMPWRPAPLDRPAPPGSVPEALTRGLLANDLLAAFPLDGLNAPASTWPTQFYGPGRSLRLTRTHKVADPSNPSAPPVAVTEDVAPWLIWSGDLGGGELPPGRYPILLSAALAPFPTLASKAQLQVDLGAGPAVVTFSKIPKSLAEAADALQALLQAASPDPRNTGCRVIVVADGLALIPGGAAAVLATVAATDKDPDTAGKLGFTAPRACACVRSGSDIPFASLPATGAASFAVTFDGAPQGVSVGLPFADLTALATALQTALQAVAQPAFQGSQVLVMGDRLVVVPGQPVSTASFAPNNADALMLELDQRIGVDPERGLITLIDDGGGWTFGGRYARAISAPIGVDAGGDPAPPPEAEAVACADLGAALAKLAPDASLALAVEPGVAALSPMTLTLGAGQSLYLGAAGADRPTLSIPGGLTIVAKAGARITLTDLLLNGPLLIEGVGVEVTLERVTALPAALPSPWGQAPADSALAPVVASVCFAKGAAGLVVAKASILGPLLAGDSNPLTAVRLTDCAVTGAGPDQPVLGGPRIPPASPDLEPVWSPGLAVSLNRVTVAGAVNAQVLTEVRDSLVTGALGSPDALTAAVALGGVRTSAYPGASPDAGMGDVDSSQAKLSPAVWPDPAFTDLVTGTTSAILTGAGDGGEMGAQNRGLAFARWTVLERQIPPVLPLIHPPWSLVLADRPDAPWPPAPPEAPVTSPPAAPT